MEVVCKNWEGFEEHTHDAIWVCVKSRCIQVANSSDGIEFQMKFTARELRKRDVPASRTLILRTTEDLVATEPWFVDLVVRGMLNENDSWDIFKEVYQKD